jgi:hypothetical protein
MPTFLLFKDGEKLSEVVGANPKALEAAIKEGLSTDDGEGKKDKTMEY